MKLCIKQRVFAWGDKYDVYDEQGRSRYFVRSELFTFGHQIHVYDTVTGEEVGFVSQRLFTLFSCFDISIGGREVGTVRRQFSLFSPRYEVDFMGWSVEGYPFGWDYDIFRGNQKVVSISKEILSWSDTYVLDFHNPADEIPGLLLVIAIDAANCDH